MKQSDNMSVEFDLHCLENGNLDEKRAAILDLHHLAKTNTALDLKRLVSCLIHLDDSAEVFDVYSLLAYLALKDEENRIQLLQISDVYAFANKMFINGSNKKVNGVLNFFAAMVHSNDDTVSSKASNCLCKTMVRTSGCLGQMCKLFLQSNAFNQSWKSLCLCLAECCFDEPENKAFSSHILLKCLREFVNGYKLELVMLTRALIEDFPSNQEKFVQLGGIKWLARNLLYQPEGIELLCVAITDCKMAVDEAQRCDMSALLKCIQLRTHADPKFAKWCHVALWKLNIKLSSEIKCIPRISVLNDYDCKNTEDEFSAILNSISKASECKALLPVFHTKQQSCISKFDAISASGIDNNTFFGDMNPVNYFETTQKRSVLDTTILLPEKKTKFLKTSKFKFGGVGKQKNNSGTFKNRTYLDKENCCAKSDQSPEKYDGLVTELCQYSEFRPKFYSTPKKIKNITVENGSYSIPEATRKRGYGIFKKLNEFTHVDVRDNFKTVENDHIFSDDNEIDHDVTFKCEETLSTSFKVRKLAKNILDYEERTHEAGNIASFIHVLTPDKNNRLHVRSIPKTEAPFTVNCKAVSTPQNSIDTIKYGKKYYNKKRCSENSRDDTGIDQLKKVDFADKFCLSLEQRFQEDVSSSINREIEGKEFDNMISLLKMGISLYGCNFKKISQLLWPNGDVSPVMLYDIFRLHIVNSCKK